MENEDGNNSNIMNATVQGFLNKILEDVLADEENMQRTEVENIVHDIVNDAIGRSVEITMENIDIFSDNNTVYSQDDHTLKQKSNGLQEEICFAIGNTKEEEVVTGTNPSHSSQDIEVSEDYSKSAFLESRLRLYTSLLRRPEGLEKTKYMDVTPCVRDMLTEYTSNVDKGQQGKTKGKIKFPNDTDAGDFYSVCDEDMPNTREGVEHSDVESFTNHLEECTNKYRYRHEESISSLRAECIERSSVNKITDTQVIVKADLLKDKVFPKFDKVKKIKTKYGKVKIHYTDTLSKEEKERIVIEAKEMLKITKQKELKDKKQHKELRNKRSFGARIRDLLRCLLCCRNDTNE